MRFNQTMQLMLIFFFILAGASESKEVESAAQTKGYSSRL